ncbi:MAG: hypothetical protein ABSH15_07595 [Verrucomicrobiota bacterium]
MNIKYAFHCTIASLTLFLMPLAFGQSPEQVLARSKPLDKLPRYKADFEYAMPSLSILKARVHGVLYGETNVDGSSRQRMETVSEFPMQGNNVEMKMTSVVLGNKIFQIFPDQKRVLELQATNSDNQTLSALLQDTNNFTLKMRQEASSSNNFYVVVITFLKPALEQQATAAAKWHVKVPIVATQERWIDAANDIVLQTMSYDVEGHLLGGFKYSNVQTNIDLPESLFEIPTNFAVVKMKESLEFVKQVTEKTLEQPAKLSPEKKGSLWIRWVVVLGAMILIGIGPLIVKMLSRRK